jgi:hypothetical protein
MQDGGAGVSESLNKARELLKTVKVMLESPSQFSHREILGHVEDVEAALSRSAEPTANEFNLGYIAGVECSALRIERLMEHSSKHDREMLAEGVRDLLSIEDKLETRSAELMDEKEIVRMRVKQYEDRIPCGNCDHVHLGMCPRCNNCPQIVPPKLESRSAPSGQPDWLLISTSVCLGYGITGADGEQLLPSELAKLLRGLHESYAKLAEPPTSSALEEWKCAKCGWVNAPQCIRCIKCLKYRDESSAPEVKA